MSGSNSAAASPTVSWRTWVVAACACPGGCGRPWRGGAVSGRRSHGHRPAAGRCGGQRRGAAELVSLVGCGTLDVGVAWRCWLGPRWPSDGRCRGDVCSGGRRSDGDRWIIRHLRRRRSRSAVLTATVDPAGSTFATASVRRYHRGGGCRSGARFWWRLSFGGAPVPWWRQAPATMVANGTPGNRLAPTL